MTTPSARVFVFLPLSFCFGVSGRGDVWADTAYCSAKNEGMLLWRGFLSRIHRKKPKGKPMPERTRFSNAQKSKVRSAVEHVFAH